MVHDALRHVEEKGVLPDESWTKHLKEVAATAFLGRLFGYSEIIHSFGFLAASETVRDMTNRIFIINNVAEKQSNSALMTFFLMMVTNPEAQKNAQAQIDAVVGRTRLPTIDDRPSLPYVDAIFREMLRYSPPVPLCE